MRRQAFVESPDWSHSKISRVLATTGEEGHELARHFGRENVIALPDEE